MEAVDEKLYTIEEVADYLKVTRQTVSRWINEGELKSIRLAPGKRGHVRISESDLKAFLEARRADS